MSKTKAYMTMTKLVNKKDYRIMKKELCTLKNRIVFFVLHFETLDSYLYRTLVGAKIMGYDRNTAIETAKDGFFRGWNNLTEA